MTVHFSGLDWLIFAAFALAILGLGFSVKLRNASAFQFLTAGRGLTLPAFVATLVTFWYGGILGISESASYFGVGAWLLIGVPYYVFAILYAFFLAKKVRGAEEISIPERVERQWGRGAGLTAATLLFLLAVPAAHVLMLGVLLQSFTGLNSTVALIIGTITGAAFLYKGGLLADVRVGFLAFVMMYVGFGAMLIFCITHYSVESVVHRLSEQGLTDFTAGKGWLFIVTYFILGAWTLVDPGFHQRVASGVTEGTSRRGVFVSTLFWAFFDLLSISTALFAIAQLRPAAADPKMIYPLFANQALPPGLKAIFFCGMTGTILSACVGYTLVSGATLGREIIGRVKGDIQSERVTGWTRWGIGLAVVLAAVLASKIDSVVSLWYSWGGCIIGALLVPMLLAYFADRPTMAKWITGSMIFSFSLSFAWLMYGLQTNNPYLNVAFIQDQNGSRFSPEAEAASPVAGRTDIPVGTMLPALVVSSVLIAVGALAGRRRVKHG